MAVSCGCVRAAGGKACEGEGRRVHKLKATVGKRALLLQVEGIDSGHVDLLAVDVVGVKRRAAVVALRMCVSIVCSIAVAG